MNSLLYSNYLTTVYNTKKFVKNYTGQHLLIISVFFNDSFLSAFPETCPVFSLESILRFGLYKQWPIHRKKLFFINTLLKNFFFPEDKKITLLDVLFIKY